MRGFILVALARVNAINWFNMINQLIVFTRASATRIKPRVSGQPMVISSKRVRRLQLFFLFLLCVYRYKIDSLCFG